jgi:hypothetical protein
MGKTKKVTVEEARKWLLKMKKPMSGRSINDYDAEQRRKYWRYVKMVRKYDTEHGTIKPREKPPKKRLRSKTAIKSKRILKNNDEVEEDETDATLQAFLQKLRKEKNMKSERSRVMEHTFVDNLKWDGETEAMRYDICLKLDSKSPSLLHQVKTSRIPRAGLGLYSTRFWPKGEYIGKYLGTELNEHEYKQMKKRGISTIHLTRKDIEEKRINTYIDAKGNIGEGAPILFGMHMINAAVRGEASSSVMTKTLPQEANVILEPQTLYVRTMRDIDPGDEFLMEYFNVE